MLSFFPLVVPLAKDEEHNIVVPRTSPLSKFVLNGVLQIGSSTRQILLNKTNSTANILPTICPV